MRQESHTEKTFRGDKSHWTLADEGDVSPPAKLEEVEQHHTAMIQSFPENPVLVHYFIFYPYPLKSFYSTIMRQKK